MKKCSYSIYRDADMQDCSNDGLSSRVTRAWCFHDCTQQEAIDWCNENNINPLDQFIIVERTLWGEDHSYAEPLIKPAGAQTFGGNFLYTSNGICFHFKGEKTCRPIPIHDRFESWEVFNAMSI